MVDYIPYCHTSIQYSVAGACRIGVHNACTLYTHSAPHPPPPTHTRGKAFQRQTVLPNEVIAQGVSIHHHKAQDGKAWEGGLERERLIPLWVETIVLHDFGPVQDKQRWNITMTSTVGYATEWGIQHYTKLQHFSIRSGHMISQESRCTYGT